jgi:hypothetical protein
MGATQVSLIRDGQLEMKKNKKYCTDIACLLTERTHCRWKGSQCDVFHSITVMTLRNGGGCR